MNAPGLYRLIPEMGTTDSDAAGGWFGVRSGTIKAGPEFQSSMSEVKRSTASKIFVIDDHPIVAIALEALFQEEPDLEIRGSARSADELPDELRQNPPDLFIVDFPMNAGDELGKIIRLAAVYSSSRIFVYSAREEAFYGRRMLQAGAKGYLMKSEPLELILEAVKKVLRGEFSISNRLQTILLSRRPGQHPDLAPPVCKLTNRELLIVHLIGQGRLNGEVANLLKIRLKSVEAHRRRIKEKLNLKNSTELTRFAIQLMEKKRIA